MTRCTLLASTFLLLAVAATADDSADSAVYKSGRYTLSLTHVEASTKIDLEGRKSSEHTLSLEGKITVPEKLNVALITKTLHVKDVTDKEGANLLAPSKTKAGSATKFKKGEFIPVGDSVATVESEKMQLAGNPSRVKQVVLTGRAIVTRATESRRLPAIVMDAPQEVAKGLYAKVSGVNVNAKNEVLINIDCTRNSEGTEGSFIIQAFLLDETGEVIGGARKVEGDVLAKTGILKCAATLPSAQPPKFIRLTAVTEFDVEDLTFTVNKLPMD